MTFRYPEAFRGGGELFLIAHGRVEGARVAGRFRARTACAAAPTAATCPT